MTELVRILKKGGIGVLATDTIYGIVGSALSPRVVERIYRLRRRNLKKPMIVLIGSWNDLKKFGIGLTSGVKQQARKYWPGKVSVILPCGLKKFFYLHRGRNTIAFRFPAKKSLHVLLKKTGPLVAPSANLEGKPPAKTIEEARKYFGDKIDFYLDEGKIIGKPSRILELRDGNMVAIRK